MTGSSARCTVARQGASLKRSQAPPTCQASTEAGSANAASAAKAPRMPATFQPIRLEISTFGPGAACDTANSCVNSAGVTQWLVSTTTRWNSGMTALNAADREQRQQREPEHEVEEHQRSRRREASQASETATGST